MVRKKGHFRTRRIKKQRSRDGVRGEVLLADGAIIERNERAAIRRLSSIFRSAQVRKPANKSDSPGKTA